MWKVEGLRGKRRGLNGPEYLVRWEGYASDSDTWEPAANLNAACVEAWEAAGGDGEGEYSAGVARSGVAGRGPQPPAPLDPAAAKEVDRRLWAGAAAEGWRVILRTYSSRDGRKIDASLFVGPSGSRMANRKEAFERRDAESCFSLSEVRRTRAITLALAPALAPTVAPTLAQTLTLTLTLTLTPTLILTLTLT